MFCIGDQHLTLQSDFSMPALKNSWLGIPHDLAEINAFHELQKAQMVISGAEEVNGINQCVVREVCSINKRLGFSRSY